MKVSIFGLGYVGAITAACLANSGHIVIGVDNDTIKVDLINQGRTPIIEKDLEPLISFNVQAGRLRATRDPNLAVQETETSLICVGTPSQQNGNIDLTAIERVSCDIGKALASKRDYHIIVNRSTVLPGTVNYYMIISFRRILRQKIFKGLWCCS